MLHLEGHPAMVELRRLDAEGSHPQTTAWQTTLARILYRCDGHTVFGPMKLQAGKHKRAVAREDDRVGRLTKVQKALSQNELLAYTFIDHLREVLSVGDVSPSRLGHGECLRSMQTWHISPRFDHRLQRQRA